MREPFTVPAPFLDEVAARWGRQPGAWRQPLPAPYAAEGDVLAALGALRERLEGGESSVLPRVYADGRPAGFHLSRHLPQPETSDFAAFEAQLLDAYGGREAGLLVSDVQAVGGPLWRRALRVARALYPRVGAPAGGALSEIFLGNYRTSFFRVHKDSFETLTFVVRGRKRFLVWPFEVFADQPEVGENGPRSQVNLEDLDYEPYRDQATVLEGGAGDVLFWPASYWHVAEGVDDAFVTTVTLAFAPNVGRAPGCPLRLAHEAVRRLTGEGFDSRDAPYPDPAAPGGVLAAADAIDAALGSLLADEAVQRARREVALAWLSGGGFKVVPEETAPPELADDDVLLIDADNPLIWAETPEEGFPCAVNGLVLTATPKFLPFLEHLNGGGAFRVGDLVARFAAPAGSEGEDALPAEEEIRDALGALGAARFFAVRGAAG